MVQVEIALYDLLPPGRLSTTFYYLGVGIYHSSIRIPELEVEFAYGGIMPGSHEGKDVSTLTGIFVLPSPEDAKVTERLMPGLRFIKRIDMGEAFGMDWVRHQGEFASLHNDASVHKPLPPLPGSVDRHRTRYRDTPSSSSSIANLPLLPRSESFTFCEPDQSFSSTTTADEWGRKMSGSSGNERGQILPRIDHQIESPTSYATEANSPFHDRNATTQSQPARHPQNRYSHNRSLNASSSSSTPTLKSHMPSEGRDISRVLHIVEQMKKEPEWRATRYHLLAKNCNNFSDELCYRLVGKRAPPFINRAAWLGQSLPCLIPDGWLDPPTAEDLQEREPVSADRLTYDDRPGSPLLAVPYVQTQHMHLDVHYESIGAR